MIGKYSKYKTLQKVPWVKTAFPLATFSAIVQWQATATDTTKLDKTGIIFFWVASPKVAKASTEVSRLSQLPAVSQKKTTHI